MKFYNTSIGEQETTINLIYEDKYLYIYSSRKSIIERLIKKLGNPTKIDTIKGLITGASWKISFKDKEKIRVALSKTLLIGQL